MNIEFWKKISLLWSKAGNEVVDVAIRKMAEETAALHASVKSGYSRNPLDDDMEDDDYELW